MLRRMLAASALAIALVLASGTAASADGYPPITPPGYPPALNVLPSTVTGSLGGMTGAGKLTYQAALLYKFAQLPEFWQALAAQQAGVATPAQTATITGITDKFRIPATVVKPLIRGIGGAATVVSGYSMGTSIGGGILDLVGFDRTGAVCTQTAGALQAMVSLLTGTPCDEFNAFHEELVANMGIVPGLLGGISCNTAGHCMALTELTAITYSGQAVWKACFAFSGFTGTHSVGIQRENTGTGFASYVAQPPPGTWSGNQCGSSLMGLGEFLSPGGTLVGYKIDGAGGVPVTPTMTSTNPTRTLKCVILTTIATTLTKSTAPYTEADGVLPVAECPDLPAGVDAARVTVYESYNGEDHELYSEEVTPEYQAQQELAPECSNGTCMLDLRKNGISCFSASALCTDWFSADDRDSIMTCHYGTHAVSLEECFVYAPSFNPGTTAIGDPTTGDPLGVPSGAPVGVDGDTFGQPIKDPTAERQCYPTGWAVLNPVEWVTKPVQCALEWAFVPRPAVIQEQLTGISTAWNERVTGKVAQVLAPLNAIPVISGCSGVPVDISIEWPVHWEVHWNFGAACEAPVSVLAGVVRLVFAGGIIVGAIYLMSQYLGGVVGFTGFRRNGES